MTEFINTSEITSSFFSKMLNVKNINDFNKLINSNKSKKNIIEKGGVILQKLILNKLRKIKKNKKIVDKRISYFKNPSFLAAFNKALPSRNDIDTSAKSSGYAPYFNNLFNINTDRWRDKIFTSRVSNQDQCLIALEQTEKGYSTSEVVEELQDSYKLKCYICGRKITNENDRMECEHILPIVTALSHWWLVKFGKRKYESINDDFLSLEYDWSHRCCNQTKSNIDWIVYYDNGSSGFKKKNLWRVNIDMIKSVLESINENREQELYDCDTIFPKKIKVNPQSLKLVKDKLQPIINVINKNMKLVGGYEKYQLFMRYKVLSAISDEDFNEAILGTLGKKIRINSKSIRKSTSRNKRGGNVGLKDINDEYEEYEDSIDIESDILYDLIINSKKGDNQIIKENDKDVIVIDENIFVNYFIDYLNDYIEKYPKSTLKTTMISEVIEVCEYVYNESSYDISMPKDIKDMIGKRFDRNIVVNGKIYDYDDYILNKVGKPIEVTEWEKEVDNVKKHTVSIDIEEEKVPTTPKREPIKIKKRNFNLFPLKRTEFEESKISSKTINEKRKLDDTNITDNININRRRLVMGGTKKRTKKLKKTKNKAHKNKKKHNKKTKKMKKKRNKKTKSKKHNKYKKSKSKKHNKKQLFEMTIKELKEHVKSKKK
jgi:hypothetical protein